MFSRRGKWVMGLLAALVLLAVGAYWLRGYYRQHQTLAQAQRLLNTTDPNDRLWASTILLRHDPSDVDALLVHAGEMFRLGRYAACRQDVEAIPTDASPDQIYQGTLLAANSIINQARNTITQAPDRGADTIGGQVTELLAQVSSYRQILESAKGDSVVPLVIRALTSDTRAMYLRLLLRSLSTQLDETRTVASSEKVEALNVQTSDDQIELTVLEQEVVELCRQAIKLDPLATDPLILLFKRHLRLGEVNEARAEVEMMVKRPQIQADRAIDVARDLLNLEQDYYLETTPQDVQLAQTILSRISPADAQDVEVQFTMAELSLGQGNYQEADNILQKALTNSEYVGHAHGICLRGRALIGMGQPRAAEQLLARLNDRNPTWEGKMVQGLAMLADHRPGMDLLRQAQEMSPASLPVRLAICQTLMATGGVEVARLDVSELARYAPMHSQVIDLRMELAAHLGQRNVVNEYVRRVFRQGVLKLDVRDVHLLAMMTLDDAPAVEATGRQLLAQRPLDPLALLGKRWGDCPPAARAEAARFACQAMRDLIDDDPLRRPLPPEFIAWNRRQRSEALAVFEQNNAQPGLPLLEGSVYLPWAYETALADVEAASLRWPQDQRLKMLGARLALWLGQKDATRQWLEQVDGAHRGPLEQAMASYLKGDLDALNKSVPATVPSSDPSMAGDSTDPTWQLLLLLRAIRQFDMPAISSQVVSMFKAHPRAEPALMWVCRDLYAREEFHQIDVLLNQLQGVAPQMAQVMQSRIYMVRKMLSESTRSLSLVGVEALTDSTIRWQQTEIEALAAVARAKPVVALGVFETLALSIVSEVPSIGVAQVDMMAESGRERTAASIIFQQISNPELALCWQDQFLSRAMVLAEPSRIIQAVNRSLTEQPDDDVLWYYRARLLLQMGQQDDARQAIQKLVKARPDAPRLLMLQARIAMDAGQIPQARVFLNQLASQGGESARVAQRYLAQLGSGQPAEQASLPAPGGAP